jgi:ABC-2 type transport system ATP-binding protein
MSLAVDVRDLSKNYGKTKVLSGVNLQLEPGRFYALVGKNGAGKSTLMRLLMRHEAPDTGAGSILGISIDEDTVELNARIGYVSETIDYALPIAMNEIFAEYAHGYPGWDEACFRRCVQELGLDLEKKYRELSRGQRMQVCLGAALAIRPRLLLLDEVTSVLDPRARGYFLNQARELARSGTTVLLATNVVTEIQLYYDHLILIDGGAIRMNAPAGELKQRFRKLMRNRGVEHPVFHDPACREIGVSGDGVACLLPEDAARRYPIADGLRHPGEVTAEDVFVYYALGERG